MTRHGKSRGAFFPLSPPPPPPLLPLLPLPPPRPLDAGTGLDAALGTYPMASASMAATEIGPTRSLSLKLVITRRSHVSPPRVEHNRLARMTSAAPGRAKMSPMWDL